MENIKLATSFVRILILNNKSWLLITKTKLSKGIYTITFKTNSEVLKKKSWTQVIYLEFHKKTKPMKTPLKLTAFLFASNFIFAQDIIEYKYVFLTSTLLTSTL